MLNEKTIEELSKPLDNRRIKHRQGGGGMTLNYLAGYDVIDTANRLLGFGQWGYDLIAVEQQTVLGDTGEVIGCYYSARVRLTVKDCVPITEEGVCAVQAGRNPKAIIDSHDMARKGAITDALKRAFRCFGDQFGNSLYDKDFDASTGAGVAPAPTPTRDYKPTTQPARPQHPQQQPNPVTPIKPNLAQAPVVQPGPATNGTDAPATDQQREAILKMAGRKGMEEIELGSRLKELYGVGLPQLSRNDASHFIKVFQGQA